MKRAGLALALLLLATAVVAATSISTSQSGTIKADPEKIWTLLVDANHWADWCPAVRKAELIKGDVKTVGSRVKFWPVIGGKKGPAVILTLSKIAPLRLLEYTASQPGMNIVFGKKIEVKDGTSEFTSDETIGGSGAPVFVRIYGQDGLDQEHREWVEAIKKKLESTDEKGDGGK